MVGSIANPNIYSYAGVVFWGPSRFVEHAFSPIDDVVSCPLVVVVGNYVTLV